MLEEKTVDYSAWKRDDIEDEVQRLRSKTQHLLTVLNSKSPMMSLLPLDTLLEIFFWMIEILEEEWNYKHPQLMLGAVCSTWRKILWSTPSIWTKINIPLETAASENETQLQLSLVREWLERSKNVPLDIALYTSLNHQPQLPRREPLETYHLLLDVSSRWRSFSVDGDDPTELQDLIDRKRPAFPNLVDLYIEGISDGKPWAFHNTPRLQRFSTRGGYTINFVVNWTNLVDVYLELSIKDILFILAAASSSLQVVDLHVNAWSGVPPINRMTLPNLKKFSIKMDTETHPDFGISSLLTSITAPALQALQLSTDSTPRLEDRFTPHLIEMIKRSRCQLTLLQIYFETRAITTEQDYIDILHHTPSLVEFSVVRSEHDTGITNLLFEFLTPVQNSSPGEEPHLALPDLKSFSYTGRSTFRLDALRTMLVARHKHASRPSRHDANSGKIPILEKLYLYLENWADVDDREPESVKIFQNDLRQLLRMDLKIDGASRYAYEKERNEG